MCTRLPLLDLVLNSTISAMKLNQLLTALPRREYHVPNLEITGVTADSRQVMPGNLFVAIKGLTTDGHRYIPAALERGAVAAVGEQPNYSNAPIYIPVANAPRALAYLCAAFHDFPAHHLKMIGVTGTDGKTTTTYLIHSLLQTTGYKTGKISTVNAIIGDTALETGLHTTTPDAPEVQSYLARMVAANAEYAVIEATSHGLVQERVAACDFDVAVVTNITHEHLDYHKTLAEYRAAKMRLFQGLSTAFRKPNVPKIAVLNVDDSSYAYLRDIPADVQLTYGIERDADVRAYDIVSDAAGLRFKLATHLSTSSSIVITSSLAGDFNVYNLLAAIAVGLSQNISLNKIEDAISRTGSVTGRMERVERGQPFAVIVDFAHTPNSFAQALRAARRMTDGKLIVVFGCAGLRDVQKRAIMGETAGHLADYTVITAEDPRTEQLSDIMDEIETGINRAERRINEDYCRVPDRAEAIDFAIELARAGDLILVAGKGHEQSMCFGTTEYPWSDHAAITDALARRGYR